MTSCTRKCPPTSSSHPQLYLKGWRWTSYLKESLLYIVMSTLPTIYELMISKLNNYLNRGNTFAFGNRCWMKVQFHVLLHPGEGLPGQARLAGVGKQKPDKAGEVTHPPLLRSWDHLRSLLRSRDHLRSLEITFEILGSHRHIPTPEILSLFSFRPHVHLVVCMVCKWSWVKQEVAGRGSQLADDLHQDDWRCSWGRKGEWGWCGGEW